MDGRNIHQHVDGSEFLIGTLCQCIDLLAGGEVSENRCNRLPKVLYGLPGLGQPA